MRIARLQTAAGIRYAVLQNNGWQHIDNPFDEVWSFTGETTPVEGAKLLAPVDPSVIVGIGHNDRDHPLPIQAWYKAVQTLANPGDEIRARQGAGTVNVEGELAVIIGKSATDLTSDNATDHVLGYTIANDVTNAGLLDIDERLFQAKAGANYTPLGPWIETEIKDPESVTILVTINGQVKARSGSFNLPSSIVDCLIYVTKWVTLEPGDVVMTGAPGTSVAVDPGDQVEISVGGIGTLANSVT